MITEIIVVDNNSTDESCAMIHWKFPKVNLITNKKNIGFSKANNQGVEMAKGEFILILNPDTVLAEDTIDKTVLFAERKSNYGAIGVKFIDGTGNFLPECKRNIPTLKIAGQKIRGNSKNYYANHIGENEIAKVEILSGAFMLIKREVYVKVGGFDESLKTREDQDLWIRLGEISRVIEIPEPLVIVHKQKHSYSTTQPIEQMRADYFKIIDKALKRAPKRYAQKQRIIMAEAFRYWGQYALYYGYVTEARQDLVRSIKIYPSMRTFLSLAVSMLPTTVLGILRDYFSKRL